MKLNTVKRMGQKVLSLTLTLALFAQTVPLAVMAADSQETATVITDFNQKAESAETVEQAQEADPNAKKEEVLTEAESSKFSEAIDGEKENIESFATETVQEPQITQQPKEEAAEESQQQDSPNLPALAAEGTVQITSADQLVNGVPAGSTYILENDISMEPNQQIELVAGVLDGAGHTVTLNGKALIKELTGTVQNIIVDGKAALQNGEGSIVCTINGGTLQNSASVATIDPGDFFAPGGLAGNLENAKIYNSFFAGTARDMFGLVANSGIFCAASNTNAPSTVKNSYFTEGNGVGGGSAWNREDASNGKKTLAAMKTPEFVQLLNASNVGSGYVWAAVEGELPVLVVGGGEVAPCDKTVLEATIKDAESKNQSDYTNETWASMQQVLQQARNIYEKIDATQEQVNEAAKNLQDAIAALVEKVRDLSPVQPPKNGVISIAKQEDFAKIDGSNPNLFYQLTQDIVIEGNYFSPNLAGVFDGNGHTITIRTASPLFTNIVETGVVQNLRVKVEGNFTNRQEFAPFAEKLKGGMIVNCISEVTGQHSAGYVRKMEDGVMVNCLTMGHNRRGAFVFFQKSTDHRNTNGYKSGKFYNCYWSASNSVENITPIDNLVKCEAVGDKQLRSKEFIAQLNAQKGKFGSLWGRDVNGYPYFGADQGDAFIDGSNNRYPVEFVWHDKSVTKIENGNLMLSPQMTSSGRFAGRFRLENVPETSTITWSCEDRTNQEIMQMAPNGELYVFHDGGGVVRAMEHKADGTEQLAAELRVVSASQKIQELRLLLDGKEIVNTATVQGSEVKQLEIQAKYVGSDEFKPLPSYLVELKAEKPNVLVTDYNSAVFRFKEPGTSKLTITEKTQKENPVAVTVSITSVYVPVKSIKPSINGIVEIHYRNSMGSGQFISLPQTVQVEPSNASYKSSITVTSSDPTIAEYDGSGYTPHKNGTVTFTAKLNDQGRVVEGKSEVSFVYTNPLAEVSALEKEIVVDVGTKQPLPLDFRGQPGNLHEITEPNLIWTFSKQGIVSIQRPDALMQVRETGGPDDGNWVASTKFEVKGLKPGTVTAIGTPVDTTGGAKPVKITITVKGNGGEIQGFDIPKFIEIGKKAASSYLNSNNTFEFGEEWTIYTLLRDGQTLSQQQLDSYYNDVVTNAHSWNVNVLPTEVERAAIALSVMGKDITNVDGINFAELICNHPNLTKQGSNALVWALIALDMNNTEIPANMKWSRERMVTELLSYQNSDGGFGLNHSGASDIDMTAMSIQALARYQKQGEVAIAIEKAVEYLASATAKNLNLGNAESISQVILALAVAERDIVSQPGFGDEMENIMSALSEYMVEGQGFKHDKKGEVDKMATAQAMQALCAYQRFLNGESGYWDLKGTGLIEDPAEQVRAMIAALPQKITTADTQAVKIARDAYEALTEAQKARVKNLDKLEQAEKILAEVLSVQQAIDALPEEITLKDAHTVQQTRKAYNQLSLEQQTQITSLKKLETAEETLKKLATPDKLVKMIDALPENITLADKDAVEAACAVYNLLSWEQQTQVTNLQKLQNAEKQLEQLLASREVQQVIAAINALPERITLKEETAVQAVRAAYNQLSKAQQEQVSNLDKLLKAEKAIENQKAAAKVETLINKLPDSISISDGEAIKTARSAYETLDADQKVLVGNLEKLIKAEEDWKDLNVAYGVIKMIKALSADVTLKDELAIKAARNAYQELTEKQKKLVLNLYILERAEQMFTEKKEVQQVEDAINALPDVITKEDAAAIKATRAAYNQLSSEQRKLVHNLDKLKYAEKALKALHRPVGISMTDSKTVSNMVDAVVEDGKVSAKQLASIQGKEQILRIKATMENGENYVLSIYGKDIVNAQDFTVGMTRESLYAQDIDKLAENAEIFRFMETGSFPAAVMVEMNTSLADGEYLLLQYDSVQKRAVLISRVQVKKGMAQFIVKEGGEYFIAQKASKKSISELEEITELSVKPQPQSQDTEKAVEKQEEPSKPVYQQKETPAVLWIVLPLLVLSAGGVFIVLKKRKENKGE